MALGVLPAGAAPVPAIHACCVGVGSTLVQWLVAACQPRHEAGGHTASC